MIKVEEMSEQRARHLESVGGAEKGRKRTFEIPPTRKIELGDLPSAYRPCIGFRARSASVGGDVLHSSLLVQETRCSVARIGLYKKLRETHAMFTQHGKYFGIMFHVLLHASSF